VVGLQGKKIGSPLVIVTGTMRAYIVLVVGSTTVVSIVPVYTQEIVVFVQNMPKTNFQDTLTMPSSPLLPLNLRQQAESGAPDLCQSRVKKELKVVTPVNHQKLAHALKGYNCLLLKMLVSGFCDGFKTGFSGRVHTSPGNNLSSLARHPDTVRTKLTKELRAGRLAGPFDTPPFPNLIISPLGLVPKHKPGEFRVIHHLSFPPGSSVNDGIPDHLATVCYATIDTAMQYILKTGKGAFLCKTDIQNAFKLIPVHPDEHYLLGFKY